MVIMVIPIPRRIPEYYSDSCIGLPWSDGCYGNCALPVLFLFHSLFRTSQGIVLGREFAGNVLPSSVRVTHGWPSHRPKV